MAIGSIWEIAYLLLRNTWGTPFTLDQAWPVLFRGQEYSFRLPGHHPAT